MTPIDAAVLCLALNVFHEARGEMIPGQYAVAAVTWNRAERQIEKVCPVVFAANQFSWTTGKALKVKGGWRLTRSAIPKDQESWKRAILIADRTISGKIRDLTGGATFYHANYVSPRWSYSHGIEPVKQLGNHLFYRKTK